MREEVFYLLSLSAFLAPLLPLHRYSLLESPETSTHVPLPPPTLSTHSPFLSLFCFLLFLWISELVRYNVLLNYKILTQKVRGHGASMRGEDTCAWLHDEGHDVFVTVRVEDLYTPTHCSGDGHAILVRLT
jgi:hypothetical protein